MYYVEHLDFCEQTEWIFKKLRKILRGIISLNGHVRNGILMNENSKNIIFKTIEVLNSLSAFLLKNIEIWACNVISEHQIFIGNFKLLHENFKCLFFVNFHGIMYSILDMENILLESSINNENINNCFDFPAHKNVQK